MKLGNKLLSNLRAQPVGDRLKEVTTHDCNDRPRLRVLDIGGGGGKVWADLKCECMHLTIVDPWIPEGKFEDPADERIVDTFQGATLLLEQDSFDFVVAIDVIEHLSVADGYLLLYEMVRLSKGFVFIYTPNGFLWQPPSPNNAFNAHISGWSIVDLKKFGFASFRGHVGAKFFWGPYAAPGFSFTSRFFVVANALGNLFIRFSPKNALAISALVRKNQFPKPVEQEI
jgi:2-polyprenyl-3-methyl-5-hydroxy-6-metoxy-1,4-benzoquinol methylase